MKSLLKKCKIKNNISITKSAWGKFLNVCCHLIDIYIHKKSCWDFDWNFIKYEGAQELSPQNMTPENSHLYNIESFNP